MEAANSKLVDVVVFADVDIEESVDDRLVTADSLATPSQVRQLLDNSFLPCCCFLYIVCYGFGIIVYCI